MTSSPLWQRRAGILLHPTSLPSGILDSDVERWLNILADTGFSVWQVLPLCEPQHGLSPYTCVSTFAINPVLLPEFPALDEDDSAYIEFCNEQRFWLDDYVLFKVLKQHFNDLPWVEWPGKWKFRDPLAMQKIYQQYEQQVANLKWQQYQLNKRWLEIKAKASALGILLFGDVPIFIGHDSADVWAHPEWFLLDAKGRMEVVTGVPPDYFSATGQRWGNPHYDWETMKKDHYSWWKSRIHHQLECFDLLRIDHFRGMEAAWMIAASCDTAVEGHWQKMPGDDLLSMIKLSINNGAGPLPFVAEDLGIITPEVTALRKKYQLPGMSILQFGFDEFDDNPHKLKNIEKDRVVYTGTHDNDTTKGWFNNLDQHVKKQVLQSLELPLPDDSELTTSDVDTADADVMGNYWQETANLVVDKMIDDALFSPASLCIIPMQDCLQLGSESRMNTPGTIEGNWAWKFNWLQHDSRRLKDMRRRLDKANRLVKSNEQTPMQQLDGNASK